MVVMANVTGGDKQLISVDPEDLKFHFELDKQSYCDLKVTNNTEHFVAFKVKTTSPKKYFVRPNTGVIHPWDSCIIRVTLQAQQEYLPDMQCKDKFLLQCTVVPPNSEVDDLPADIFNKESGRTVEERKLKVIYASPNSTDDEKGSKRSPEKAYGSPEMDDNPTLRHLKDERDSAVRQTQQLQQEIDMLRRRRQRKGNTGFSMKFALLVVLIGIILGFLLRMSLSSPSSSGLHEEDF